MVVRGSLVALVLLAVVAAVVAVAVAAAVVAVVAHDPVPPGAPATPGPPGAAPVSLVVDTVAMGEPLLDVVASRDGARVYVRGTTRGGVLDTATNTVVGTLPVAEGVGMAVSPDGTRLHSRTGRTFATFDTATGRRLAAVPTSSRILPNGLTVTADGRTAYLVDEGTRADGDEAILVVDLVAGRVAGRVPAPQLDVLDGPVRSGHRVLGSAYERADLYALDTRTGVLTTVPSPVPAFGLPMHDGRGYDGRTHRLVGLVPDGPPAVQLPTGTGAVPTGWATGPDGRVHVTTSPVGVPVRVGDLVVVLPDGRWAGVRLPTAPTSLALSAPVQRLYLVRAGDDRGVVVDVGR